MPLQAGMPLQVGMEAPQFELPDADMDMFSLSALRGKKNVVVYFYPKDDTPGCTMEANEFTDLEDDFAALNTVVVGISRDDCMSHAEFRDKYGLSVVLLSDEDSKVCRAYRVLQDKELENGHKIKSIQRSTFVVDKQGKLRHVMYGVHAHGHPQEILKLIKELK